MLHLARQRLKGFPLPYRRPFSIATEPVDFGEYDIILPPEPFVFGVSHIAPRTVPPHIPRPPYVGSRQDENFNGDPYTGDGRIKLGGQDEKNLRSAARLAKMTRQYAETLVKPGVTTNAIDEAVHNFIVSHSAYPSPLLYSGFPRSCCISINNILVHGIPDDRPLQNGDVVNVDITVYLNGFHGDTSQTFLVGNVDPQGRALVDHTKQSLAAGIAACGPGLPFKGIGQAIFELTQKSAHPFSINRQFTGHGIGTVFHRPPWILHHRNDEPGFMLPGHCFTIEPCIVQGDEPTGWIFPDGWTASTQNCARAAQAEHMVLITETGVDVLTE